MAVLLIRHAVAQDRDQWAGDDALRPLTAKGRTQAHAVVSLLHGLAVDAVLSSPAVRCVDTVEPLARARGLRVRPEDALFEGNTASAAQLVRHLVDERADIVLCTHGDVIPDVMHALGLDCHRCAKGSIWVVDGSKATYIPAP